VGQDIDGEAVWDRFGSSVAMSEDGSRMAIGGPYNDGNGTHSGHVRILDWDGTTWIQVGQDIDGEAAGDRFGTSVSMSADGNRVAIGGVLNAASGSQRGHVRILDWNGTTWIQVGQDIDGEAAGDAFGMSVSMSGGGNRVAISGVLNDASGPNAGHVRIMDWNGTTWIQVGQDIDGEAAGDQFGRSLAMSADGTRVAIGASENTASVPNAGHVRILDWGGTTWNQVGQDIDGEAAGDQFGWWVAISANGNRVVIGAGRNDGGGTDSGHVRVLDWNGTTWNQLGQDIDGEAAVDRFGYSVDISANGNRVAIGGYLHDGAGGTNRGHVRILDWDGTTWNQVGQDIDGEAAGDQFGYNVALSADGKQVSIGAHYNEGNKGTATGHVRVYKTLVPTPSTSPSASPSAAQHFIS
jgi:hypothetical protein